jgi:hypothetical protein
MVRFCDFTFFFCHKVKASSSATTSSTLVKLFLVSHTLEEIHVNSLLAALSAACTLLNSNVSTFNLQFCIVRNEQLATRCKKGRKKSCYSSPFGTRNYVLHSQGKKLKGTRVKRTIFLRSSRLLNSKQWSWHWQWQTVKGAARFRSLLGMCRLVRDGRLDPSVRPHPASSQPAVVPKWPPADLRPPFRPARGRNGGANRETALAKPKKARPGQPLWG